MGTFFEIQAATTDTPTTERAIEAAFVEVARVEALISEWQPTSEISALNREAGKAPVAIGPELMAVLARGQWTAKRTAGAFDMTVAALFPLWSFDKQRIPTRAQRTEALDKVDFNQLVLNQKPPTAFLKRAGMRIGVGGIGKGYGVDCAARVLDKHGLLHYVVNGGGDMRVRGKHIDRPWRSGISHPRQSSKLFGHFDLTDGAVVTSGDYERYFLKDGVRYHHILDPKTGDSARRMAAITVLAPTAMDADALATGLFVMGPAKALALVEELDGVEALLFDSGIQVQRSSGFPAVTHVD